ncbi:hypothetical protein BGZ68_007699 [Mortierella alpina]|nr:hypothetical protein BGZ68_007699 [Mortierella alpina]
MQLDSILSDQLSSPAIQSSEPNLHSSNPSDLDCGRAFEASLPPTKRDGSDSSDSIKGGIEYEGTAESTVCQQSLLFSIQNDALPLDLKTPTDPTRPQEQEQQPQQQEHEQLVHQPHLVLLKVCSYPSSASSLTPLSAEGPSLTEQRSPETASLFTHRGADPTRREQERLLSEPQLPENKDLESILKSPSLAQHPHIIYPACLSTTSADDGSLNAPALTGTVAVGGPADLDHTAQNPVSPHQPLHQKASAPAPTGIPSVRTHADTSVEESTTNNSNYISFDTCAFLFSAQSNICTYSSAPSSANQMTSSKNASKAKVVRLSTALDSSGDGHDVSCENDCMSDEIVDTLAIGAEKKRPTGAESETNMLKKRKKSKGQDKTKGDPRAAGEADDSGYCKETSKEQDLQLETNCFYYKTTEAKPAEPFDPFALNPFRSSGHFDGYIRCECVGCV